MYDGSHVTGANVPQFRGALDMGLPLPLPHSSVWLRSAAGIANGDPNNVVANFYFGAFGNNYVDDHSVQRYRDYYSMPGFQIDQIGALNYVREMLDWNQPAIDFYGKLDAVFMDEWKSALLIGDALQTIAAKAK